MSLIYDLDIRGMRKAIKSFGNTVYGRTVFLLAYFIPGTLFASSIAITTAAICMDQINNTINLIGILLGSSIISFVLANIYYYKELKDYRRNKRKMQPEK